jgi:hypothetical protein
MREGAMAEQGELLVHNVYFSLSDRSEAARQRLLDACRRHLAGHAGIVLFACGELCAELAREVNERDWDVGLHIVFKDKAAHDHYQQTEAHLAFIAENRDNWARVRVFDTVAARSPTP